MLNMVKPRHIHVMFSGMQFPVLTAMLELASMHSLEPSSSTCDFVCHAAHLPRICALWLVSIRGQGCNIFNPRNSSFSFEKNDHLLGG